MWPAHRFTMYDNLLKWAQQHLNRSMLRRKETMLTHLSVAVMSECDSRVWTVAFGLCDYCIMEHFSTVSNRRPATTLQVGAVLGQGPQTRCPGQIPPASAVVSKVLSDTYELSMGLTTTAELWQSVWPASLKYLLSGFLRNSSWTPVELYSTLGNRKMGWVAAKFTPPTLTPSSPLPRRDEVWHFPQTACSRLDYSFLNKYGCVYMCANHSQAEPKH